MAFSYRRTACFAALMALSLVSAAEAGTAPEAAPSAEAPPRVLLLAQNAGTEITDLLVPFAVLSQAGIDVEIVAQHAGPVALWPALELTGLRPVAAVDPASARWLVMPAVRHPEDPELLRLLRDAADRGTFLAAICDGVTVLAHAGLLDGHQATGHFYSARRRARRFPAVHWREDRRYVYDRGRLSSAGVSASAPAAVELVRRLAGAETAAEIAAHFGISADAAHDATAFRFGLRDGWTALRNQLAPKRRYRLSAAPAMDEYALAFLVDVLGRTGRAALALDDPDGFTSLRGLRLRAAQGVGEGPELRVTDGPGLDGPGLDGPGLDGPGLDGPGADGAGTLQLGTPDQAVGRILQHVAASFGRDTARFVAKQLELPYGES